MPNKGKQKYKQLSKKWFVVDKDGKVVEKFRTWHTANGWIKKNSYLGVKYEIKRPDEMSSLESKGKHL